MENLAKMAKMAKKDNLALEVALVKPDVLARMARMVPWAPVALAAFPVPMVPPASQAPLEPLVVQVRPERRAKMDAMAFEDLSVLPAHVALLERRAPREIQAWLGAMA